MKRSQALRNILKILKKWDNCKIEKRMAEEVLSCLENIGMRPPERCEIAPLYDDNGNIFYTGLVSSNGWENEETTNPANRRRTSKSSK